MIQILPKNIREKIAAGEVVERPASVVKELIENSIDANADRIIIEIKNGGKTFIKVSDNGIGIPEEEIDLAVRPYATSKIKDIEDLFKITFYGFRGEALNSISSVSKFTLISRTAASPFGIKLYNTFQSSGKFFKEKIASNIGTIVIVENLFYNLPARRKFLKSEFTEYYHILNKIIRYALINPKIEFKFFHNQKLIFHHLKSDFKKRSLEILNLKEDDIFPINFKSSELEINGYFTFPSINSNKSDKIFLYVNKRPVFDKVLLRAIKDGYQDLIPKDSYPIGVLDLRINPKLVDVNIHPKKSEVKIENINEIYKLIVNLIKSNFSYKSKKIEKEEIYDKKISALEEKGISFKSISIKDYLVEEPKKTYLIPQKDYRILGQIKNSYIIVEKQDGIYIIDQHAASERINLEKLKRKIKEKENLNQHLLIPVRINLDFSEKEILMKYKSAIEKLGFSIEFFSGNDILITSIPKIFKDIKNIKEVFLEILADIKEIGIAKVNLDKILHILACRSAIKFGDNLSLIEQEKLVGDLFSCENFYSCAHGRPTFIKISFNDLEKKFCRV